jgi:hypothetical protein
VDAQIPRAIGQNTGMAWLKKFQPRMTRMGRKRQQCSWKKGSAGILPALTGFQPVSRRVGREK